MSLAAAPDRTSLPAPGAAGLADAGALDQAAPATAQVTWVLSRGAPAGALERTMREFGVSAPLAQVLWGRGLKPAMLQSTRALNGSPHLRAAARQLAQAIRAGKRIRIHGDYDADGVTASTTLLRGIQELGGQGHVFIPDRIKDGYGINIKRVPEHIQACDLLVSVDCGVTAIKEVSAMLDGGLEVIITDHHAPGEGFPACIVVHPQHPIETYDPNVNNLTGAGVAYHLVWALRQEMRAELEARGHEYGEDGEPVHLAPIATIGTIADVAPLLGENRALCEVGLSEMSRTEIPGLLALLGPREGPTRARDVAFGIAPKINAAGRMGEADIAVELLMTDDAARAAQILEELDALNDERKQVQERMYEQALAIADPREQIMVVTHPDWHAGVMGIVASKLLERFGRPVFIIAQGKGSARSTPGISAYEALKYADDLLVKWGGHPGAAGFSVKPENIEAFRARLQEFAAQFPTPRLQVHVDAPLGDADHRALLGELAEFEPFGHGFAAPAWHVRAVPENPRMVGKTGRSLQLTMQGIQGIKHGHDDGPPQGLSEIAALLSENEWRGVVKAQWQCNQIRGLQGHGRVLEVDLSDLKESTLERVKAAAPRITRLGAPEAIALLSAEALKPVGEEAWQWSAHSPEIRTHLLKLGLPQAAGPEEDDQAAGSARPGIICFDVPDQKSLARWLRQKRAISFAFSRGVLQRLLSSYAESYDETRCADQALAYHEHRWAHGFRVLSDEAFAADVLSLAGVLEAPSLPTEAH